MKIDLTDVNYIAKLAKLKFSEEEANSLAEEFESILTHFELIDKIDLSDIGSSDYSEDLKSVLRKDEVSYFEDKTKLFKNVKSLEGTSIKVPRILE